MTWAMTLGFINGMSPWTFAIRSNCLPSLLRILTASATRSDPVCAWEEVSMTFASIRFASATISGLSVER